MQRIVKDGGVTLRRISVSYFIRHGLAIGIVRSLRAKGVGHTNHHLSYAVGAKPLFAGVLVFHFEVMTVRTFNFYSHPAILLDVRIVTIREPMTRGYCVTQEKFKNDFFVRALPKQCPFIRIVGFYLLNVL